MRCALIAVVALSGVFGSVARAHEPIGSFGIRYAIAHRANGGGVGSERPLATRAPAETDWHHTRRAPAVGNGRLFDQRVFTRRPVAVEPGRVPTEAAYGAGVGDRSLAYAVVGTEVVAFSPWERFASAGLNHLNRARAVWLDERGYTGGVRTFVNPRMAARRDAAEENGEGRPRPAGWFRVPADVPRTRGTERVRYSVPPGMNPRLAARLADESAASGTATARR